MIRFRLSRQAESDLEELTDYIADRNPSAATRELDRLLEKFSLLGDSPLLGQLLPDLPGNLRSFTARSFVILYSLTDHGIEVARVVHASRDIGTILRENEP
jgi:toxin ParE1/3/4